MFALNDDKSFSEIPNWLDEFQKYIPNSVPIALAGNKKDLVEQRKVSENEARKVRGKIFRRSGAGSGTARESQRNYGTPP